MHVVETIDTVALSLSTAEHVAWPRKDPVSWQNLPPAPVNNTCGACVDTCCITRKEWVIIPIGRASRTSGTQYSTVVESSKATISPALISAATCAASAFFTAILVSRRVTTLVSANSGSTNSAPPRTRSIRPSSAKASKSRWIVIMLTPKRCARSSTRACPCSRTVVTISARRDSTGLDMDAPLLSSLVL